MAHAVHITDVFFHAEIARAAGRKASDQWLSEQTRSPISSSSPRSPAPARFGKDEAEQACRESERSHCSNTRPPANQMESECVLLSDIEIDDELGDRVGLLFTDAAHTVLWHVKNRRNSL